ncbi:protein FAM161A isoform X2 [Tribolium madens]|uniref:protein FAM161A isoform X2 n=1 Tax=Tribolium madens TaxID=41895 RepID=UPI001CF75901|nr:protein FAM161A isoform X2 [Tribolium madens]
MSDHSSSVFNNSCLKLPRNPKSHRPLPVYEQKYLNQLQNEATKLNLESSNEISMKARSSRDKDPVKSFIEFFDSIPEYDELNHLSSKEFYKKIELLKEKQKTYTDYVQSENNVVDENPEWLEEYKNYAKKKFDDKKKKTKPFCVTPILNLSLKPPSRRSVRIETPSDKLSPGDTPIELYKRPKSRLPSVSSKGQDDWDNFSIDDYKLDLENRSPKQSKSAPNSPARAKSNVGWKDDGITIPKPFEMTVRDEENKIVEELMTKTKPKEEKPELFKAHPVPIESQIPLFDKIMADQERKNKIVRERSKALLQAQMRPFSFTRRDEEIQNLTKGLSKSSPSLFLDDPPIKVKKFKAKPIPKNLFSNYIYKKMHEDEFYRALQKKIRAEEMLRAASLPPSMAKRERTSHKYDVCPRSYRDVAEIKPTKPKKNKGYKCGSDFEKELEELKNEFLDISPKLKFKRNSKKQNKGCRNFSASSCDSRTPSSLSSINRSNLAAVLRIQSARKRLEMDMCRKLEEAKLKEEARWREKLMRKKPVWQTLAYSHEEDLAMRLQLRRDEEKLRSEEHKLRMQLMLGRVNQQPTLFERQSQVKYPRTKDELLDKLYTEYKSRKKSKRSISDLSDMRTLAEVKDAAIQDLLDDDLKQDLDSLNSKESIQEEKEKCDSISSEDNHSN